MKIENGNNIFFLSHIHIADKHKVKVNQYFLSRQFLKIHSYDTKI